MSPLTIVRLAPTQTPPQNQPTRQLKLEKKKLREIWVKISKMHKKNEEDRSKFEGDSMLDFVPPETQVMLNVGGQVFQTTASVLTKDKFSILAALCSKSPPLEKVSSICPPLGF